MKFKLTNPIGKKIEHVFVKGEVREFNLDQYEKTGHGVKVRSMRKERNIGLREAARIIGCSAHELSMVETGRAVFEEESDFDKVMEVLRGILK